MKFNLICASHDDRILSQNLVCSQFFKNNPGKIIKGYTNISVAYNSVMVECNLDEYNVYSHHDVYLPQLFEDELKKAILQINLLNKNWGVLGVFGARMETDKRKFYGHVRDRGSDLGTPTNLPHEVQTLDEL